MTEQPGPQASAGNPQAEAIAAGYTFEGVALELGGQGAGIPLLGDIMKSRPPGTWPARAMAIPHPR